MARIGDREGRRWLKDGKRWVGSEGSRWLGRRGPWRLGKKGRVGGLGRGRSVRMTGACRGWRGEGGEVLGRRG